MFVTAFYFLLAAWLVFLPEALRPVNRRAQRRVYAHILLTAFLVLMVFKMNGAVFPDAWLHLFGGAWLGSFLTAYVFNREKMNLVFIPALIVLVAAYGWEWLEYVCCQEADLAESFWDVGVSVSGGFIGIITTIVLVKNKPPQ